MSVDFNIIGSEGNFGSFFKDLLLLNGYEITENSNNVILSVPFSAYEEVCYNNKGKHLINICSVQSETNNICRKYSNVVTGIHPLFGRRTGNLERKAILTFETIGQSEFVVDMFDKLSCKIYKENEENHDYYMSKTHLEVVLLNMKIKEIMEKAKDVPEIFLTPSFIRLREFAEQYGDMPDGTKSSILSNKFRS